MPASTSKSKPARSQQHPPRPLDDGEQPRPDTALGNNHHRKHHGDHHNSNIPNGVAHSNLANGNGSGPAEILAASPIPAPAPPALSTTPLPPDVSGLTGSRMRSANYKRLNKQQRGERLANGGNSADETVANVANTAATATSSYRRPVTKEPSVSRPLRVQPGHFRTGRRHPSAISLHRCRFVEHVPPAINALAFTPQGSAGKPLLACARANGDIEIWNPVRWHNERTIPGTPGNVVEGVLWLPSLAPNDDGGEGNGDMNGGMDDDGDDMDTDDDESARTPPSMTGPPRLFSTGLDGYVTEWDLVGLSQLSSVETGGGAVWCMAGAPSGDEVAVACEDGSIRVFSVGRFRGARLAYKATIDRKSERALSLTYHPSLPILAAGFTNSRIHLYSTESHSALASCSLERLGTDPTLVWSLAFLPDGLLASADSLGAVSFWSISHRPRPGRTGSMDPSAVSIYMVSRHRVHGADALCLAASSGPVPGSNDAAAAGRGPVLFSSGVDRKVVQFCLAPTGLANRPWSWVPAGERRYHSHDVRALALLSTPPSSGGGRALRIDALVSGGVDTALTIASPTSTFPSCRLLRMPMFPQRPLVSVAERARLLLSRADTSVKVWALGRPAVDSLSKIRSGSRLDLDTSERLLAEIRLSVSTMFIENSETRLFRLSTRPGKSGAGSTRVSRVRGFPPSSDIGGSSAMCFAPDGRRLILAGAADSVVRVVDVSAAGADPQPLAGPSNVLRVVASFRAHSGAQKSGTRAIDSGDDDEDGGAGASDSEDEAAGIPRRGGPRELVTVLTVSADGQWLASGDLSGTVHVHSLDALRYHATLPRVGGGGSLFAALAFHPSAPATLVGVTVRNEVFVFDAEDGARLTDWSREYSARLPDRFLARDEVAMGVTASRTAPEKLVVWAPSYICTIDLSKPLGPRDSKLTRRKRPWANAAKATAVHGETGREPGEQSGRGSGGHAGDDSDHDNDDVIVIESSSSDEDVGEQKKKKAGKQQRQQNVEAPEAETETAPAAAVPRKESHGSSFTIVHRYGPLMYFGFAAKDGAAADVAAEAGARKEGRNGYEHKGENRNRNHGDEEEAVAVERPLLRVLDALPDSFWRKKY
ncbi:U3 small nucleolar RNA-associated protein 4, partial [Cladochytrium tenue]